MADLLSTGISGLLASQVGLQTVSQNISNASTPGYSRQTVNLAARQPEQTGGYFIGQGVDVVGIQRSYSQYLTTALWNQDASLQSATTFSRLTSDLNNLLAGSNNVQTALDRFYSSIQDAANAPASVPTRQAVLGSAASLASTFQTLDRQLGQQSSQINQQITASVASINSLAQGIANLNQQIASAGGNSPPNDLLDQRDQMVQQLAEQVGITTSRQGTNINVFTGNGQTLVNGATALTLQAAPDPYDPTQVDVVASTGANVDGQLQGGTLAGLLSYRSSVLQPALNQLGQVAIAFASAVNTQNSQGMDLNGNLGGNLFAVPSPQVLPAGSNSGAASISASIGNVGALTANDYVLRFNGSNWSATTTGGNPVSVSGTGTAADPLTFDGLQLVVSGSAAAGDSFEVEPTRAAAGGIQLAVTDPSQLALAAPVNVTAASGNQASVAGLAVNNVADPNLLAPVQIAFTSATTYSINGAGSFTYTPGTPIQQNGWSLSLSGTPAAGDSFSVSANTNGAGDNSNALAIGRTATLGVLNGGKISAGSAYATLVATTGTIGAQANTNLTTQTSLFQQAQQAQQSVAGVNLDEEAGNLVKFQQAYQASAQVITTANNLFNTLINAVRS